MFVHCSGALAASDWPSLWTQPKNPLYTVENEDFLGLGFTCKHELTTVAFEESTPHVFMSIAQAVADLRPVPAVQPQNHWHSTGYAAQRRSAKEGIPCLQQGVNVTVGVLCLFLRMTLCPSTRKFEAMHGQ
eukprot:4599076-Amphidinium_carterae.1